MSDKIGTQVDTDFLVDFLKLLWGCMCVCVCVNTSTHNHS